MLCEKSEIYKIINFGQIYFYIEIFVMLLLSFKLLFIDKISFKRATIYLLLIFIFVVNAKIINSKLLVFCLLFVLNANYIDYKDFLKKDLILKSLLLLFIISLCLFNVIPDVIQTTNGVVKHSLGFRHPNFLCPYIITLIIEYICLKDGIHKKIGYIFIGILLSILYFITRSRTSLLAFLIAFLIYIVLKNNNKIIDNKIVKRCINLFPICLVLINFILIYLYSIDFPFINSLNELLSGRIKFGYTFLSDYNMTFFGQNITLVDIRTAKLNGLVPKVLDMAFIHLLLKNGIIIFLVFVFSISTIQYFSVKKKNYELILANIFFILTALSEVYIYNVALNFVLILFLSLSNNKREEIT